LAITNPPCRLQHGLSAIAELLVGSRYNNKPVKLFVTDKAADNTVVIAVSVVVGVAALCIVLSVIAVLIYCYKLKTRCKTSQ